jgi:hypothetical protein
MISSPFGVVRRRCPPISFDFWGFFPPTPASPCLFLTLDSIHLFFSFSTWIWPFLRLKVFFGVFQLITGKFENVSEISSPSSLLGQISIVD